MFQSCSINYSKHVVKFHLLNAVQNIYPIENFEFIETTIYASLKNSSGQIWQFYFEKM